MSVCKHFYDIEGRPHMLKGLCGCGVLHGVDPFKQIQHQLQDPEEPVDTRKLFLVTKVIQTLVLAQDERGVMEVIRNEDVLGSELDDSPPLIEVARGLPINWSRVTVPWGTEDDRSIDQLPQFKLQGLDNG